MNTFLRLFSNSLLLGRIRYSLSQDACQKMSKPTTSPDYQPLTISASKNREWGKWGMSGEKIHKKMGIPFQITSIFPKKQFCFTPNYGFLYCFRFIPSHTREHGYPKRKHKSQKNETDIALKIAPFWKIHSFFKLYGKLTIALTT